MSGIPEATPIRLTAAERTQLEGLARSTKVEYRLRQRARIVLLAANGMPSRAIGRAVGCTTGTASKWRVRYARERLAGLDETGERGAEPKYTAETDKRMAEAGILLNTRTTPLDESGPCYKNLDDVLETVELAGLATVAHRLKPVACIKGAD